MGIKVVKMGKATADGESLTLHVDERGRITIPQRVRERLGIEPNAEVHAQLLGSVLTVNPKPSERLQTASAGREDWEGTTPSDAGASLFGPGPENESQ